MYRSFTAEELKKIEQLPMGTLLLFRMIYDIGIHYAVKITDNHLVTTHGAESFAYRIDLYTFVEFAGYEVAPYNIPIMLLIERWRQTLQNEYHIVKNNCEHVSRFIATGVPLSSQVPISDVSQSIGGMIEQVRRVFCSIGEFFA